MGVISRNEGMTAECSWIVNRAGFGFTTSVSVGGDPLIRTPPEKNLGMFERDPKTEDSSKKCRKGRFSDMLHRSFKEIPESHQKRLPD